MNIKELIIQQKVFYKSIVSVFCPILNDTIYFTSDGWHHILYERRRPRRISEQYMKLKCLIYASDVIKNCTLISETRQIQKRVKNQMKSGIHHELVHEVSKGKNMRVIIERIGTGKHKFLSIMPHDKKSKTKKHP